MNRHMGSIRAGKTAACLLCLLFCAALFFPMTFCTAAANDENPYHSFTTVEELRGILEQAEGKQVWAIDGGDTSYAITENLTIPANSHVFFEAESLTVATGTTLCVEERGSLFYYNLLVQGTVIVNGSISQKVQEDGKRGLLQIEGKLINNGWIHYDRIQGLEKLENGRYGRMVDIHEEKAPVQTTEPEPTETETPEISAKEKTLRDLRMKLRRAGFRLRFFFLRHEELMWSVLPIVISLLCAAGIIRRSGKKKKQTGGVSAEQVSLSREISNGADMKRMFDDAKKRRIDHLDEWLKSGLIDREEYRVLKERYMRDQ
ncbi:MAG: hypothetical protein K6C08_01960 [Oscillospiraceae bacterium]|nr:hypothetical protein [Oscillospiraceae bacterium]